MGMTKEQIMINDYTKRIKELGIELNALRRHARNREAAIKEEIRKLEEQIENVKKMTSPSNLFLKEIEKWKTQTKN